MTTFGKAIPLTLAAMLAFFACGKKPDPAQEAVEAIAAAAGERDAAGVIERLAADFRGSDGSGRAEVEQTLRRYLAAYESLDVSLKDLSIERAPASARVRFRADLSGSPRKVGSLEGWLPRTSSYRFDLRLVPEGDSWKVAWAAWEPVDSTP